MILEPFEEDEGYRVWLSENEQQQIIDYYAEEPRKQVAMRAMLYGLRSEETRWLRTDCIETLQVEDGKAFKLRVREGKTGFREVPISQRLKEQVTMLKNARGVRKTESVVDVTPRTVQRWVSAAGEALAQETGDEDWNQVSAHDLRRSWATSTYYAMNSHYATSVIMSWGGWESRDVFEQNYLGRPTDELTHTMMQDVGIV